MAFRNLGDEFRVQATEAIAASGKPGTEYSEYDSADLVAAAAAIALERGAPNLFASTHETKAARYMEQGTREWRALLDATARFIEKDVNGSEAIGSRGEGVGIVVADVLQTVQAHKILSAAGNKDMELLLNDHQKGIMEEARKDQGLLRDMSFISRGMFESLSPEMAESLETALATPLGGRLGEEVSLMKRAVDGIVDRDEQRSEEMRMNEEAYRGFSPISDSAFERVERFHREALSTGDKPLDKAMNLLTSQGMMDRGSLSWSNPMMIAQARIYQEGYSGFTPASADLASMAVSDANIIQAARHDFKDTSVENDFKGEGHYHLLEDREAIRIERQIMFADATPPIDKVRLEVGMIESAGIAGVDRAHMRAKEGVSYEPDILDEMAKAADAVLKRHDNVEDRSFTQMEEALVNFRAGKDGSKGVLVESADFLASRMDDLSISNSKEWEDLSKSVDRALGISPEKVESRAASMAAFESERKENPVEHVKEDKASRADHMAALQQEGGAEQRKPPTQLGQQLAAALGQGFGR
jgi:hypothetical protein